MAKPATPIKLRPSDERILRLWIKEAARHQLKADRARIVLLASQQLSTEQIARELRVWPALVSKWRTRFASRGIDGLENSPRPGKPRSYTGTTEARVLSLLREPPPEPHDAWTGPLIARCLGDVSVDYIWRLLRFRGITLRRPDQAEYQIESPYDLKCVSVLGIYLSSSTSAFLVGVVDRARLAQDLQMECYVRVPGGPAGEPVKPGSSGEKSFTLLQALQWAISLVKAGRFNGHERRTLADFITGVLTRSPASQLHAFVFGSSLGPRSRLHTYRPPTFDAWKHLAISWLAVFLSNTSGENPIPLISLSVAIEEFVSADSAGMAAAFEWYACPFSR